jgi:uncharacterized protein YjbJ (UPF0337 family)
MINAQELQGQWNTIRGQVKQKWGQLTDDDLSIQSGNVDQLVGRIQQKTGEGRESIEGFLTSLTARGASAASSIAETARGYAEQASEYAAHAGDRLRSNYGQVSEYARERLDRAEDVVRHNPTQSVAAAFGFGIVLGVVVGMALRSR